MQAYRCNRCGLINETDNGTCPACRRRSPLGGIAGMEPVSVSVTVTVKGGSGPPLELGFRCNECGCIAPYPSVCPYCSDYYAGQLEVFVVTENANASETATTMAEAYRDGWYVGHDIGYERGKDAAYATIKNWSGRHRRDCACHQCEIANTVIETYEATRFERD